jgi:hypothetical protein
MAKYTSGRQKNLKVGLTSYSENKTSLEVVGKVGIGTTNATSSLYVVGDQYVTGVSTLGEVKISSGIITSSNPGVTTVTFVGNLTGTASTAGFAYTAYKLEGFDVSLASVGFASTASDVIGGIASVSQLSVSGFSTVGVLTATRIGIGTTNPTSELVVIGDIFSTGITTLGTVKISSGIVTSTTGTAVTYFGDLRGNSDTTGKLKNPVNIGGVQFDGSTSINLKGVNIGGDQDTAGKSGSSDNLTFGVSKGIYFRDISGTTATTSNNLTFDGNNLKVSGITTVGGVGLGNIGIKIDGTTGIISSSNPGVTTVTYYGTLIGTAQVEVENITNTSNVIGGIASVTELYVSGISTVGVLTASRIGIGTTNPTSELWVGGNVFVTGIATLGTVKISSGIITSTTGTAVTFFGDFVGTASSAGFAYTAFTLNNRTESQFNVAYASTAGIATNAGYATTAGISTNAGYATTAGISTNVIGGIASVSSLFVNEIGISTLGIVKISSGIVTSTTTGTAVTFYGNFVGTATSAGFAQTAFSLSSTISSSISVGFATTATNVIGGIASVTQLSVSGLSTVGVLTASRIGIGTTNATVELFVVGNSRISGIVTIGTGISAISLNGTTGIITASGVGTVTYFGDGSNLTGIKGVSVESQAQVTQPVFLTLAVNSGVNSIGIATTGSTALSFNPSTGSLGIGTTNPTSKLFVNGNSIFGGTGIVTAVEYNGNLRIGTPSGGFKTGAVGIITADFTKDSINDINSILGKLVPKPPTTIAGVALNLTGFTGTGILCSGFTPTNNAGTGVVTPTAGTTYYRNSTSNTTISSLPLMQYGPGDSGTVTAFVNSVGVGTTTLSSGSNNGTYGSLVISNDKDAVNSTRNTGIASGFYEIYDVVISGASSPNGFNCASIRQGISSTTSPFWYQDPSTISAPILSTGTINTPSPSTHVVLHSSGIPHYTENVANAFTYVLTCQNASRDMYSNSTFCTASGGTSGLISPGNKTYVDFGSPTLIPPKDFGVGIGSTTLITQTLQNTHIQLASPVSFHTYTAQTPYGSAGITTTLSQIINIMGTTPTTSKIDEDNINVTLSDGGANTGPGTRTIAISGVDNPVIPTPYSTSWIANLSLISGNSAGHEAVVVGGVLKHDLTNYTSFLPSGPNYSGKSTSQYFQFAFTRTAISKFGISVVGTYSSCWVCLPNHTTWKTNLSNTNGWANMFIQQPGTPANDGDGPGCSFGAPMIGIGGNFNCTFGSYSSTGSNGLILIRFKLDSGKSITSLTITNPTA